MIGPKFRRILKILGKAALYAVVYSFLLVVFIALVPLKKTDAGVGYYSAAEICIIIFGPAVFLLLFFAIKKQWFAQLCKRNENRMIIRNETDHGEQSISDNANLIPRENNDEHLLLNYYNGKTESGNSAYGYSNQIDPAWHQIKDDWNQNIDYMDGHTFEYFCADMLKHLGYYDVQVTPGSGDNGVDIFAKKNNVLTAFQCKRYGGNVGNSAVQEVFAGGSSYGAIRYVVITNSSFTKKARELADALGVELWDRSVLFHSLSVAYPNSSSQKVYKQIEKDRRKQEAKNALRELSSTKRKRNSGGGCLTLIIIIVVIIYFCAKANSSWSPEPSDKAVITTQVQRLTIIVQTTANINLRKSIGTNTDILIVIPKGTKLECIMKKNTPDGEVWYRTTYNNKTGWIMGKYTREISP